MNKKMITAVVPVFNMDQYLEKAVKSLLNQTYENYEIILVDDGSTDNSALLIDSYAKKSNLIRAIHKENGGLSSARNRGIEEAKGDYIIFPDPDDWVDSDYLQALVDQISNQVDLEICGNYIVTSKSTTIQNKNAKKVIYNNREAITHLLAQQEFCGFAWNKLYHMDIIRNNNLRFDEELGMAQDLHFAFRYILKCRKIAYDPKPHYYYVQHEAGVTNINHPLTKRKISGLKTYQKLYEMAEEYVPEAVPMVGATIANQNLSFLFIYYNSGMDDPKLLDTLKDGFKKYRGPFFRNKKYTLSHKWLGLLALINPKIYVSVKKSRVRMK